MSTVAHNLDDDNDLIGCEWFASEREMSNAMKVMMSNGWTPGLDGLMSVTLDGVRCIARPIKIKGNLEKTGIGIWRVSDEDEI